MPPISRRELLALSAAAAGMRASPLGLPIGSQTYPFRQRIRGGDFAGVCQDLAGIGVGIIELCSPGYGEFAGLADARQTRKIIADHGLQCPSSHFTMRDLRTRQQEMIGWALGIGMTQMGTASLGGAVKNGVTTMDTVKRAADEYNGIAAQAAKSGIQQFLHDEGFEVSKLEDGRLTYQVLLEALDPKLVKMQFQMSAMRLVGDPAGYFTKYPGRFLSMHLQGVSGSDTVAIGHDTLDWPAIFAAAKTGGVRNYFVEMSWDLTVPSVAYLKTLK